MDRFNDDSQFHEISFEEFEDMIAECSEVEIPLRAFQDFVDEVNGYEENLSDELFGHFAIARALLMLENIQMLLTVLMSYRQLFLNN